MLRWPPKSETRKEDHRSNKVEGTKREREVRESKPRAQKGPPPLDLRFFV